MGCKVPCLLTFDIDPKPTKRPRLLKPRMLIRSVIDHKVDQHAHASLPAVLCELHKVADRPIPTRIDPAVIASS
jgi:hypothetical protein